ncbi:peptidylprolyl isomerase [Pseudorhodoferax soli]|jgi:peptidyl-prolyl cis-trans isomerase A (cyclophilin A)|uniref:Peptidyl-prolyl cis-trans isomerase n=1 Tax=Pseudorhodoferax soli TaxID=545864 RepID=A0A368X8H0_9BURK|nr:peptidylprolyl isomerase [Pseudorhodoferax soli]RCW64145.1 peptidyl-prolyl cis-trans isomerase A (cyclophilin A)/peptidyl-prolyl cis-trans isomerase B (cyclophilin B) [Pseudorhodoferax soli]
MTARLFPLSRRALVLAAGLALAPLTQAADAPRVLFKTSVGSFTVEVYPDKAPKTVENFLQYVREKHYDGTIFHRVIPNFMAQGGGYDQNYKEKPTRAPVTNEASNGLKNDTYTIAMARTGEPHSATSQFFINVNDNAFLNHTAPTPRGWGYTVFGKVVAGMDVVQKIKAVPTGPGGPFPTDVPQTPILIQSATLVK